MLDVLEHLAHPGDALRHAIDLLRPNGGFIATVPAFNVVGTNHDELNHHVVRYTKSSFRRWRREAAWRSWKNAILYHWPRRLS